MYHVHYMEETKQNKREENKIKRISKWDIEKIRIVKTWNAEEQHQMWNEMDMEGDGEEIKQFCDMIVKYD